MTLEEAQAEILRLKEENTQLKNEKESLSKDKETLTGELEDQRKLNQHYFNKLNAQYSRQEDETDDEEEEVQTCEDFARSLNIL